MTATFTTFAAARNSGLFAEATRAGVTKETLGQWHNLAHRWQRLGDTEREVNALQRCIEIDNIWGSQWEGYSMSADTRARIETRLKELIG